MFTTRSRRRLRHVLSVFVLSVLTVFCDDGPFSCDDEPAEPQRLNLILDTSLSASFPAGSRIALYRIADLRVAEPDACPGEHVHTAFGAEGILIDGAGPFADPNPTECGFGRTSY